MFAWDPELETGIPTVDAQHRAIFEAVEGCEEAMRTGLEGGRVEETFAHLHEYVALHFAAEERLMRDVRYPGLASQVREHREFSQRLQLLVPLWDSEGDSVVVRGVLLSFLRAWLVDHLSTSDRLLATYLAEPAGRLRTRRAG